MDSITAEAQIHGGGRWERAPMGGWKRTESDDKETITISSSESGSDTKEDDDKENDEIIIPGGLGFMHTYTRKKRCYSKDDGFSPDAFQPPQKKKKTSVEPLRIRPHTNDNMDEYDVSSIHLEVEDEEELPVFDTCDDIREKIRTHLTISGMTRAAFMRLLCSAAFPTSKKKIQDNQLVKFQSQNGAKQGCESNAFYAAYVYFEKLRLKRKEPKSERREDMEMIWGDDGMPRKNDRCAYITTRNEDVYEDEYGVRGTTVRGFARSETVEQKARRNSMMRAMSMR